MSFSTFSKPVALLCEAELTRAKLGAWKTLKKWHVCHLPSTQTIPQSFTSTSLLIVYGVGNCNVFLKFPVPAGSLERMVRFHWLSRKSSDFIGFSSSWNHVPGSRWAKLCWTFIGRCLRAIVSRSFPEEEDSLTLSGHWTSMFSNRTSNQCVHLLNSEVRLNCWI